MAGAASGDVLWVPHQKGPRPALLLLASASWYCPRAGGRSLVTGGEMLAGCSGEQWVLAPHAPAVCPQLWGAALQGMLCRGGAASLPLWVRLCPGEGGHCVDWPRGAGEVCGDRTEGCWGVKQRPRWAVPAGAQLLCSPPFL